MYLASFGACSGSSQTNDDIFSKNHQCRNGFSVQLLLRSAIQGIQRVDHCPWRCIPFSLLHRQHPTHTHDHRTARPAQQEHPKCHQGANRSRGRRVQGHYHHVRRVFRPLCRQLAPNYLPMGGQQSCHKHVPPSHRRDSGSCCFCVFLMSRNLGM